MKFILLTVSFVAPIPVLSAGGFEGPPWITYVEAPLLISFPFTFFYIGYLCFRAVQHNATFVWLYVVNLCLAAIAIISAYYLATHENAAWLEWMCVLSWLLVPMFAAFISHKINVVTKGKYRKSLRLCWSWTFISLIVIVVQSFLFELLLPI